MPIPKQFLRDKFILLLVTVNAFAAFLCVVLVLLRLGSGQGSSGYIVQYRASVGISAFRPGGVSAILGFMVFSLLVLVINLVLSIKVYELRRELSIAILALGILLLILATIVSNALLVVR